MSPQASQARAQSVIAIVEDDPALLNAIAFSLTAEGYPVRRYMNAEALLAEEDLAGVSCFAVDQGLPGMNGLALIRELRRRQLAAAAVLVTTRPTAVLRDACWALGVPIVEKPILGESLNACIRGLLAKPHSK